MTLVIATAGASATAAGVNELSARGVVKPTDESVSSSTTMQPDNDLLYALTEVNATYEFSCYLDYEGGTINASDLKWQWAVPAGAVLRYQAFYVTTANALGGGSTQLGSDIVVAGSKGAGVLMGVSMHGGLTMSTTTGNIALSWAQNTSSATATIVHAASVLRLLRLS
jgi:hypothetical protein